MRSLTAFLACAMAATLALPPADVRAADGPLALNEARVSIDGTSNIHAYTASTTSVRVTGIEIDGAPGADVLEYVLQPGRLKTFTVVIPAASLASSKGDIDKNMHKALKTQEHPDIRFRLVAVAPAPGGGYEGRGWLTVAGVEKEVVLALQVERKGTTLAVTGTTELLMTDYGIAPPKAMLGMLKTNPKVRVRLELLLAAA